MRETNFFIGIILGYFLGKLLFFQSSCVEAYFKQNRQLQPNFSTNEEPLYSGNLTQASKKDGRKRALIGIMTTPEFLRTRVEAFRHTWLRDLENNDIDVLFFSKPEPGFDTVSLPGVHDHVYPPQKKAFKMLAYYHDELINKYDWFLRLDDDTALQLRNLDLFLTRLNATRPLMIGNPGFGRNALDYVADSMVYCMGGPGVLFSNELIKQIRPFLSTCTKELLTEHEDVEIGRCVWKHLAISCTNSKDLQTLFFQNWSKMRRNVESGSEPITNPKEELSKTILQKSLTMHSVKLPEIQYQIRLHVQKNKILALEKKIELLKLSLQKSVFSISTTATIAEMNKCKWNTIISVSKYTSVEGKPRTAINKDEKDEIFAFRKALSRHQVKSGERSFAVCSSSAGKMMLQATSKGSHIILRKQAMKPIARIIDVNYNQPISFITPVSGREDNLIRFLQNWKKLVENDKYLNLIIAVGGNGEELSKIRNSLRDFDLDKLGPRRVSVIECGEPFARGRCLNHGIKLLQLETSFFICDVDLLLQSDSVRRIRILSKDNAYFPVFFSQYENGDSSERNEENGFWRSFSFGMAAMKKSTFDKSGGFDKFLFGWGGEDTALYEDLVRKEVKIVRAIDPGIFHPWHSKSCPSNLSAKQHSDCVSTRASHKSSKTMLSRMFFADKLNKM